MPHQIIDILIISILVIGFVLGFKDGFVKKILSFAGFIIAIMAAFSFSPRLKVYLINLFEFNSSVAVVLSFILIFILILLLSKIIIKIIRPKKSVFGFVDRTLGGLLGTFQTGLFLSGLLIFLSLFKFPDAQQKTELNYYEFTYNLLPETFSFIKKVYPDTELVFDVFDELKAKLNDNDRKDIR